jgi:hypothetical protein
MRTYAGGCLGAVAGLLAGLVVGVGLAVMLVPQRPGQALDNIKKMLPIIYGSLFLCTVAGCVIGALLAVPKGPREPSPPGDE